MFDRIMPRNRLLIMALLTLLAISFAGGAHAAFLPKKDSSKHVFTKKEIKDYNKGRRKDLKKKEKQERKQAKLERKKESNKKPGLSKFEKKQQRKDLKKKQKQERKKLKQEQKKRGKTGVAVVNIPQPPPPSAVKKKREIFYPHSQLKPRYRIDVLAAMYLDDLVKDGSVTYKDRMPEKASAGVAFYEGISIAADSLKRAGFNIDIYVHDVTLATESVDELVKKGSLDTADLIIGALQPNDIAVLADYAKKKHINFISALSASDAGVRDNEYFTMIQPSLKSHCMWIDSDVARRFAGLKAVEFYRTTSQADSIAHYYIAGNSVGRYNFKPLLCNSLPHKSDLLALLDTTKPNVVVIPVLDIAYADSLLSELSHDFPTTHFEVYGMPSWNSIPGLRNRNQYPNLSVNVTTAVNIDPSTEAAKYVSHTYKSDYGGKPSEIVYRGYEAMFWYANLLKNYGPYFNAKYNDNSAAPFTKFEIKLRWDKNDDLLFNENTHLFVTKYESGNVKIE